MTDQNAKPLDKKAILYMLLLSLQFGLQPVFTRKFTPPTVNRSSVILMQETVKFGMAYFMLHMSGGKKTAFDGTPVHNKLVCYKAQVSNYSQTQAGRFRLGYLWRGFLLHSMPFRTLLLY